MASSDDRDGTRSGTERPERERPPADRPPERSFVGWFTGTLLRVLLTVVGIVLLLFALSQAFGVDLLEMTEEALTTETGQWLVVAFVALLLIGAAQRGIAYRRP